MAMNDLTVRPSTTLIKARYALALLVAGLAMYYYSTMKQKAWLAVLVVPAVLVASALSRHLAIRFTTLELAGDRLKLDSGVASKTSRSVPLGKVQDITVSQTLGQRLLGVGDITVVTAGDGGLTIRDVSGPKMIAEKILERVGGKGR